MLLSATASVICSSIVFIIIISIIISMTFKGTGRSPASSVGCESLQPTKMNVALFKDRLDVILEAFILSTNTPMA